ncbi:MAG: hypothetical protein ABIH72_00150 [archaeon]
MSLKEKLGIQEAELCRFPEENSIEKVPVLFIEFKGEQPVQPVISDFLDYLNKNYTNYKFEEEGRNTNIAADPRESNSLMDCRITSNPQAVKILIRCYAIRGTSMKFWLHNPGVYGTGNKVNREEMINNYIKRLEE